MFDDLFALILVVEFAGLAGFLIPRAVADIRADTDDAHLTVLMAVAAVAVVALYVTVLAIGAGSSTRLLNRVAWQPVAVLFAADLATRRRGRRR